MKNLKLLITSAVILMTISLKAQVTESPAYTPKLFLNTNILEYKLGAQFDGFTFGLDPVYNLNDRLKINGWLDIPLLDGKIKFKELSDNDNDIKKYSKIGAGVIYSVFEQKGTKTIKFILSVTTQGNQRITRYVEEEVPFKRQYGIRAGIERFRYIAVPNEKNATVVNDLVYLNTPQRQLTEYEGIANWHMNCLYAGISRNDVYSVMVKNSYGTGTMARYMDWYADVLLPVTLSVDDVKLGNSTIPVTNSFKKNPLGFRVGVSTVGFIYVKIETGAMPGIKSGFFFNTALGYTFKVLKQK